MITDTLRATPRRADVLREQLRAVGLALRPGATAITALLATLTLLFLWSMLQARREGSQFGFNTAPQMGVPGILLGLIVPLVVWKSEDPSRRSYLWSLPVDRGWHQLAKSGSGWLWFMGSIAAYLLWGIVLALLSGSDPSLSREVVYLGDLPGRMTEESWRVIESRAPLWQWALPFVAGTATYLAGTAAALLSRHPWRWLAGAVIGYLLVLGILEAAGQRAAVELWASLVKGPYGLEVLMTGNADHWVEVPRPGSRALWWQVNQPDLRSWLTAAAIWTGAAGLAALYATRRHQEP